MRNPFTKNIFTAALISLFAVSCSESKEIKSTYVEGETASTTAPAEAGGSTIVASNPGAVVNGGQISAPIGGAAANNPEHGKPGHRCDIAVGAPLNSPAPAGTANTQTMTVPQNPAPQQMQPTQKVAAGMNPAHGQPNHRCDIAVGAPLNSPPGNATPAPQKAAAPIMNTTSLPKNSGSLAINPAHGEPGHSCAVAVGAPLK